jgi:hypothetical protein
MPGRREFATSSIYIISNDLIILYSLSSQKQKGKKFIREVEGEWINGVLQNNDGVEGQGCSNLLRSLMFDGERLWGP